MKAHIFQHVPFEGPAAALDWLTLHGFEVSYTRFYENHQIPPIEDVDWLIIMGGSMSVNDEAEYQWLVKEKAFIKQCIHLGKTVVGICLGSQLIASALKSSVYKGSHKEIGWYPLNRMSDLDFHANIFPDNITVFHWHGETFDLPQGARLIASTEACKNQIFLFGNNVLAMQCHLEMTPHSIMTMLKSCASEIQPAPYIQTIDEIISGTEKFSPAANQVLFALLTSLKDQH